METCMGGVHGGARSSLGAGAHQPAAAVGRVRVGEADRVGEEEGGVGGEVVRGLRSVVRSQQNFWSPDAALAV